MLKLLHFADLHLGIESYGRLDSATGMSTRLLDFLTAFDEVIEYATSGEIDLVLFAGDAYKTRDPNPTVQREFARRIRRLSAAGVPTVLLLGNHDLPNAQQRANSVEIFDTLGVEGVYVARKPEVSLVQTRKGPVQVVVLPWVMRSTFLTREEHRGRTLEQLNELMLERISGFIDQSAASLDLSLPAVLLAHATVFGADFGSEKSVMLGNDIVISRGLLANRAFDYVALGHIHKHQILGETPLMAYSGSLERVDFGEEGENKGFMVVELDETQQTPGRVTDRQFRALDARRFLTLDVEVQDEGDPTETVLQAIERRKSDIQQSVVKLVVRAGLEAANRLRDDEVRRALKDAYFVAAIIKDVKRSARLRLGSRFAEDMDPSQALRRYLEIKNVPEARAKVLLAQAQTLICRLED